MRERFAAQDPRSWMFRFHTQTAGSTLTAQQPDVNIVRVTLQALAAVLGGTQSLHTNSRDEALALPTETSALLALRTQQIIANESGVPNTVDPLAGSYALETLTDHIEQAAEEYLKRIDALGGVLRAIETGYLQREIQQSAFEYQKAVESGERVVVGVNPYISDAATSPLCASTRKSSARRSIACKIFARAAMPRVAAALREVEDAAGSADRNLMPGILSAVKAYATVGEISDALRKVFGEYQESVVI